MNLEHYSEKPLEWPPRDVQQVHPFQDGLWKPRGLWVSVKGEDDWPSWCEAERFRPERLAARTIVNLSDDANLKIVSGRDELIQFDDEFGVDWALGKDTRYPLSMRRIDWPKVAESFDGVIIAPYVWSCRLGDYDFVDGVMRKSKTARVSDWYYPWDCASGCIWNAKAIESFEIAENKEETA